MLQPTPGTGPLLPGRPGRTLVDRLAPVADRLRQLATSFGIRPYRVFLVRERWNGERRGEGEAKIERKELLPTPRVTDLSATRLRATQAGRMEDGDLRVDRISLTYTEDELQGLDGNLDGLPENESFFWEVTEDGGQTPGPPRRRYALVGVPYLDKGAVQWAVVLKRQQQSLTRAGDPEEPA